MEILPKVNKKRYSSSFFKIYYLYQYRLPLKEPKMKSIVQFFEESVEKFSSNVYMWEKPGDKYEGTTYGETRKQVYEFAAGLINLGIKKGDRLSLISEGRNSWVIGELGILYTGAVNVPLSAKLNPDEIKFRMNHSESRMILDLIHSGKKG